MFKLPFQKVIQIYTLIKNIDKMAAFLCYFCYTVCARKQGLLFKIVYFLKKVAEEEIKMVDKEDAELTSHTNTSKIDLHVEQSSLKTNWRQTVL